MGFLGGINDSGIESQPHEYETVFGEILRNLKRGFAFNGGLDAW